MAVKLLVSVFCAVSLELCLYLGRSLCACNVGAASIWNSKPPHAQGNSHASYPTLSIRGSFPPVHPADYKKTPWSSPEESVGTAFETMHVV